MTDFNFNYELAYTADGAGYYVLKTEDKTEAFWADVRQGVAAAIALPLTVLTYVTDYD